MPAIILMSWNIENFGDTKFMVNNGRDELIDLICAVIDENVVSIAGFQELRSNRAAAIGQLMVTNLDARTSAGRWAFQASPKFVKNRWEQYLFVWDTHNVGLYNAPNSFQSDFASAAPPPALIGFPRQKASDRPPYLGYFQSVVTPGIKIPVAVFHAPEPKFAPDVRDACRALATVAEFNVAAEACAIMGDFNVKTNASAAAPASLGNAAFANLVGLGFQQLVTGNAATDDRLTSLIAKGASFVNMVADDCYSQPYDNIFLRPPNPNAAHTVQANNAGLEELMGECINGNYLEPLLQALHQRRTGVAPGAYAAIEDAFEPFRRYVSDHMPVMTTVQWI